MTRPDFKLTGRLCQKHRRALDDRLTLVSSGLQQARYWRIIDHIEYDKIPATLAEWMREAGNVRRLLGQFEPGVLEGSGPQAIGNREKGPVKKKIAKKTKDSKTNS